MANPQIDILLHQTTRHAAGTKAEKAIEIAAMFAGNKDLTQIRFWAEDYDAICRALRSAGHRADGFKVGNLKAVRYVERG